MWESIIFISVGSPTIQIPFVIFLFFSSLINKGAPIHAVSSSNVREKCISLERFDFENISAKANEQAKNPFMSQEPLPYNFSSFISAIKGSVDQPLDTGTTSVWPERIIGSFPFGFFAFNVAKRFTLFFSSSKTLKDEAPHFVSISSQ